VDKVCVDKVTVDVDEVSTDVINHLTYDLRKIKVFSDGAPTRLPCEIADIGCCIPDPPPLGYPVPYPECGWELPNTLYFKALINDAVDYWYLNKNVRGKTNLDFSIGAYYSGRPPAGSDLVYNYLNPSLRRSARYITGYQGGQPAPTDISLQQHVVGDIGETFTRIFSIPEIQLLYSENAIGDLAYNIHTNSTINECMLFNEQLPYCTPSRLPDMFRYQPRNLFPPFDYGKSCVWSNYSERYSGGNFWPAWACLNAFGTENGPDIYSSVFHSCRDQDDLSLPPSISFTNVQQYLTYIQNRENFDNISPPIYTQFGFKNPGTSGLGVYGKGWYGSYISQDTANVFYGPYVFDQGGLANSQVTDNMPLYTQGFPVKVPKLQILVYFGCIDGGQNYGNFFTDIYSQEYLDSLPLIDRFEHPYYNGPGSTQYALIVNIFFVTDNGQTNFISLRSDSYGFSNDEICKGVYRQINPDIDNMLTNVIGGYNSDLWNNYLYRLRGLLIGNVFNNTPNYRNPYGLLGISSHIPISPGERDGNNKFIQYYLGGNPIFPCKIYSKEDMRYNV
jgi:hypothetical protein